MPDVNWLSFVLFMALVLSLSLYGLTASGHFPREHRAERLRTGVGPAVLWLTIASSAAVAAYAVAYAARALPWHMAIIGAGAALLIAPLLLQPLPDAFVDGRRGLLAFAVLAALLAGFAWRMDG